MLFPAVLLVLNALRHHRIQQLQDLNEGVSGGLVLNA